MSEKLKVLAVCQEDPEHILGGMGRHVQELYRAMAKRDDVEIDLLTMGPHEGKKKYMGYTKHHSDKLVCYKPRHAGISTLLISDIQMARTLTQLLVGGKRWDAVHVHEWNSVQTGRMVRDALSIPMVGTMHLCISKLAQIGSCPTDAEKSGPLPEADIYLMNQEGHLIVDSDEVILCSQAYKKIIGEVFMTDRPINVIYNGIRTDEWCPDAGSAERARQKHRLPNKPIALFVGRIADMKGIREILDVVEAYDSGYCIVLAGEVNANSDEAKESWDVTKRIRALQEEHPERLQWVGFQHDRDLKDLYAAADVGLMPSIHEPFGITALEHMAMGVPLIASERDGLGEIVTDCRGEEYALIIEPIAEQINEALIVLREEAKREELKWLGLQRAKDFSWTDIAEQTVEVYHSVLSREKNQCQNC